jgi:hypothetical protein
MNKRKSEKKILCTALEIIVLSLIGTAFFYVGYFFSKNFQPNEIKTESGNKILAACIDFVDLGNMKSEKEHDGLYNWKETPGAENLTDSSKISSTYGAINNPAVINKISGYLRQTTWRDSAYIWGVKFQLNNKTPEKLIINLLDNSYYVGEESLKPELKPTAVMISCDNEKWRTLGTFTTAQQKLWTTYSFEMKNSCKTGSIYVLFNDSQNINPPVHYGKTIDWIAICS